MYKVTQFRQNIYSILDKVIKTGVPVQIEKNGQCLSVVPVQKKSKLANLKPHDLIVGDSKDLVHLDWSKEWKVEPL